jgi:CBS domain-containing protein
MDDCQSGAILVNDRGRPVGIVSERDCAHAVKHCPLGAATQVRDLMVPCEVSVSAGDSLYECLHMMNENRKPYLPVLDGDKAVALISREQVLADLVVYLERVFHEYELDQQIVFLRGTYSC